MGFHPHMYASVHGFDLVEPLYNLAFKQMTVDFWRVTARRGARGRYVSMHPRVVIVLDGPGLLLKAHDGPEVQGSVCFIPAGVEIRGRVREPGEMAHLDIHLDRKALLALTGGAADITRPIILSDPGPVAALAGLLAKECRSPGRGARHAEHLAQLILLEILHHGGPKPVPADAPDGGQAWLAQVRSYALGNLRTKLSVDTLAGVAGMSRTSFNRRFRQAVAISPYQWLLELRCEQAQRLMQQGVPFAEVAALCGFADQAHYNRVFKAVTGQSPGGWLKGRA